MAEQSKGLQREKESALPRRRRRGSRERQERDERRLDRDERRRSRVEARASGEDEEAGERERGRRPRERYRHGRPPLADEVKDLNRGGAVALAEGVALTLDMFSRVLQGAVDRAFDEDYAEPGDLLRGAAREADLVGYDLVDELRRVPRQLDRRFEEGIRSPRAERGERWRRQYD